MVSGSYIMVILVGT
jgi:hypothetical protein